MGSSCDQDALYKIPKSLVRIACWGGAGEKKKGHSEKGPQLYDVPNGQTGVARVSGGGGDEQAEQAGTGNSTTPLNNTIRANTHSCLCFIIHKYTTRCDSHCKPWDLVDGSQRYQLATASKPLLWALMVRGAVCICGKRPMETILHFIQTLRLL